MKSEPLNDNVLACLNKETGLNSKEAWQNIFLLTSKAEHDNEEKAKAFDSDKKGVSLFQYADALSYDWRERGVTIGLVGFTTHDGGKPNGDAQQLFDIYKQLGGPDLGPMSAKCSKDKNDCKDLCKKIQELGNDPKWIEAQWKALCVKGGYIHETMQAWKAAGVPKPSALAIATVFDCSLNQGHDGKDGGCVNLRKLASDGDEDATLKKFNAWRRKVAGTNEYNEPAANGHNRADINAIILGTSVVPRHVFAISDTDGALHVEREDGEPEDLQVAGTVSAEAFVGDGSGLTGLVGGGAFEGGTVPNDTIFEANVTAAQFFGDGSQLTGVGTGAFAGGTVLAATTFEDDVDVMGNVTIAGTLHGDGSGLTNLPGGGGSFTGGTVANNTVFAQDVEVQGNIHGLQDLVVKDTTLYSEEGTLVVVQTDLGPTDLLVSGNATAMGNIVATHKAYAAEFVGNGASLTGVLKPSAGSVFSSGFALVSAPGNAASVSTVTGTELARVSGVTAPIQTQLNSKQAVVTGAAASILTAKTTPNRALISDADGNVAVSSGVSSTALATLAGINTTVSIQTQLDSKQNSLGGSSIVSVANISLAPGSASNNAIYFGSDRLAGVYQSANSQVAVATAGQQRLLVSNVGAAVSGNLSTGNLVVAGNVDANLSLRNSSIIMNDNTIFLRGSADQNHGLRFEESFTSAWQVPAGLTNGLDGPVLFGYGSATLGTIRGNVKKYGIHCTNNGNVYINGPLVANSLNMNSTIIYLKSNDINSGLAYSTSTGTWQAPAAPDDINGAMLFGSNSVTLGTVAGGRRYGVHCSYTGKVFLNGDTNINGSLSLSQTSNLYIDDGTMFFRGVNDSNHGVKFESSASSWGLPGGTTNGTDGPMLFGWGSVGLGTLKSGKKYSIHCSSSGNVYLNGPLSANAGTYLTFAVPPFGVVGWFNKNNGMFQTFNRNEFEASDDSVLSLNRINNTTASGDILRYYRNATLEAYVTISSSGVVTQNTFTGAHCSQLAGLTGLAGEARPDIKCGTVMSSVDAMCVWKALEWEQVESGKRRMKHELYDGPEQPGTIIIDENGVQKTVVREDNLQLAKCKISDTVADKKVYGVFDSWDEDGDASVVALGTYVIRIAPGGTVHSGDLLESDGTGCARAQSDDLIRSSTVGKVVANVVREVFSDQSYLVPCVLYCG